MKTPLTAATISLLSLVGAAHAAPTVEFLPTGFLLTDLSEDGTRGCGNVQGDGSYETFLWVRGEGEARLGLATVPVLGSGAGSPDISYDGARISATILSSNNLQTQGVWEFNVGWTETMPPQPVDGGVSDNSYGSAWGLSGDGTTLVGFYWSTNSRAIPSSWSSTTGMVGLSHITGRSARVDAASFDGSVVVGWETSMFGPRLATIWRNGVKMIVADGDGGGGGGVYDITGDGSFAVGFEYDESVVTRVPTLWTWNGSSYDMQNLNFLPGTIASFGQSYLSTVSNDGQIAGGSNVFTQNPGGPRAGIIWTPQGGVVDAVDYFADLGIADQIPANFEIREVTCISPDGNAIAVIGLLTDTFEFQTMLVYLDDASCEGDTNGDNIVNFTDLNAVLAAFGQTGEGIPADVNGDGIVNFADLNEVLANFGAECN